MKKETAHYRSVNENPCNMCMPMGAILPFKGVAQSIVIIHGSQGCSTYMRRHIAEHFNEPIDVASSSLNEKGTIYGGEASLKKGLDNVMKLYNPGLIGVLTTCLSETIGEDVERIALEYLNERGRLGDLALVTVATPGYGGTHTDGYFRAVQRIITRLVKDTKKHARMHLPVAPNCNISCNYCNRKFDCLHESRPGVTSEILSPETALQKYKIVKEILQNISVIGIAGPGDALANWEKTRRTIALIKQRFRIWLKKINHLC